MSLSKFFVVKYCGIYEVFVTLKVMIHYEFVTMFHSLHCSMLNTVYCLELFSMCDIWGASPNANFKWLVAIILTDILLWILFTILVAEVK